MSLDLKESYRTDFKSAQMMACRVLVTWLTRMKCEEAFYGNQFNRLRTVHRSQCDVWMSYSLGQYNFFLTPSIFVRWVYSTQCFPHLFKNEQNMSLRILLCLCALCFWLSVFASISLAWLHSASDPHFGDQLCMLHCFDPQWVNLTVLLHGNF